MRLDVAVDDAVRVRMLERQANVAENLRGFVEASTQSNRRSTVMGSMTRSYCGGRYGPRSKSAICQIRFARS